MEQVLFQVPKMYADHHVLVVREVLLKAPGVEDVYASAAFKRVLVSFDPEVGSQEALLEVLTEAGYGPDECILCDPVVPGKEDGSFWHTLRPRDTETNPLDVEMSGDFRKY
jgi:copper chaperone CopZ